MWAIASDIHANFEAFRAVLDDVDAWGVEKLFLLGDLIGYGPNPLECIDLARAFGTVVLKGNFDVAMEPDFDFDGWSSDPARRSVAWARTLLYDGGLPSSQAEWLAGLDVRCQVTDTLFVHGSPRNPLNEYVFPEDIYNPRKLDRLFPLVQRLCFHGHTHVPGVIRDRSVLAGNYAFLDPDPGQEIPFGRSKALIDVGSVGQPRDGDPRACYVLFDGETVRFRRVEYDVEETIRQMSRIPELEPFLGERLREGR